MPSVSDHAVQRAKERFHIKNNVKQWIQEKLTNGFFVNKTISEDGSNSLVFSNKNMAICLSTDLTTIKTVMIVTELKGISVNEGLGKLQQKINNIVHIELKRTSHTSKVKIHNNKLKIAELEIEMANINLLFLRARSKSRKISYQSRINAIKDEIENLKEEIDKCERENRKITLAVSMYYRKGVEEIETK
jgi:hypothetical protein